MKIQQYFVSLAFVISLTLGCSKEPLELTKQAEDKKEIPTLTRHFGSVEEANQFLAKQEALLNKEIEVRLPSFSPIERRSVKSFGSSKIMSGDSEYFKDWGWQTYNFEFESLKNIFPHLLEFNVYISPVQAPTLGAVFLTAGGEFFPGIRSSLQQSNHNITGTGRYFNSSLNYIYVEEMSVGSVVIKRNVFRTQGTVKHEPAAGNMVIASLNYTIIGN